MRNNYLVKNALSAFLILTVGALVAQEKSEIEQNRPDFINISEKNYQISQSKNLLKESLRTNQNDDFRTMSKVKDNLGFTHEKFQQYYKGIKVEFSTYTVHSKQGKIEKANGEFKIVRNFDIKPKLTSQDAFQKAIAYTGAKSYMWEYPEAAKEMDNYQKPTGELVILPLQEAQKGKSKTRLAYKFDMFTADPVGRGYLYIDANTGEKLLYNAIIKHVGTFSHGKKWKDHQVNISWVEPFMSKAVKPSPNFVLTNQAETRYSGTQSIETRSTGGQYTLNDDTRKVYTRDAKNQSPSGYPYVSDYNEFTDNDNNWTTAEHSANKDNAALDAHWAAEKTYDYFKTKHNRDSYDGNGIQIRSYVHVGSNYDNAFWNGSVMSYGDGSSNGQEGDGYFDALTSMDVGAHEIGHAICEKTANLVYQRESGALNEGFSDIWGAAVEHYAKGNGNDSNPSDAIWLIGDEIDRRTGSAALRSMSDPKSLGYPDTYGGTNWVEPNCGTPTSSNDYCGVHTNSGVINHWFYILTEGKSGTNDIGNSYNVTGIGIEKAAKIAYRLESVYLSANSTYEDARTYGITAAQDLYGANSTEVIATTNAFHAVGVGSKFGEISYCTSKGNSVADEYIQNVKIGTINKTSDGGNGYSDFTSTSTNVSKNESYTITITPKWTGTTYNEGYAVWIDYNNDGDFNDANENVWSKAISKTTPVSGSFTIPSSASEGEVRMRVSMKYNGVPTACEAFSYGEVEDYTLVIGGGVTDIEAPTVPANLTASNITTSSVDLSWTASTDNVGVKEYDVYQDDLKVGTTVNTSYNVTGLNANTTYSFSVLATDDAGNSSSKSNAVEVTTENQVVVNYCDSKGNNARYEWIDNVSMGGVNNDSGAAGYSDFTNQVMTITKGSNRLNVSAGFASSAYTEYWKAWIDYDQDGTFESTEIVLEGNSNSSASLYQDFTVPTSALIGNTRLRVSMKYNASQTACETFSYGEVEDYTVNITNSTVNGITHDNVLKGSNIKNEKPIDYISLYPNPVKNHLNIKLETRHNAKSSFKILSFDGKVVKVGKIDSRGINVGDLPRGIYIVEVNDGQKLITKKIVKQ
ncbi:neutral protease [Flavobacteriaceae bacterium UJ101]|nr:neutral protease [Flavobacteriaceae bacterium UJ101]